MIEAKYFNDLSFLTSKGKIATFNYKSNKRIKTKVLQAIKKEHNIDLHNKQLKEQGVKIVLTGETNKYKRYDIIDMVE